MWCWVLFDVSQRRMSKKPYTISQGEGSNDAHDFFKWASWRGMGDRTVRQALPRVLNKDITLPTHHA